MFAPPVAVAAAVSAKPNESAAVAVFAPPVAVADASSAKPN